MLRPKQEFFLLERKKMTHTHTHTHKMNYYSAIKNEIKPFSAT